MDSKKKLPNFLIVGAAKSGTTSIYKYLDCHPEIKFSRPKEPKYFSSTLNLCEHNGPKDKEVFLVKDRDEYIKSFGDEIVKWVGDASADNLYYYKDVIPEIKKELGNPLIFIFLRNPVERAYSSYVHMRREEREPLHDFNTALQVEEKRISDGWEFIWHYKKAGLYYNQVKAYKDNFEHCHIFLFDDIKNDLKKLLSDIYSIFQIEPIFNGIEKKHNVSGLPNKKSIKQKLFYKFFKDEKNSAKLVVKKIVPECIRKFVRSYVTKNWFEKKLIKPKMDERVRNELIEYYRDDILKLEKLIQRDLSNWLK